jgi:ssDNA-binding Zn-finger/Zn-ribbon topoisomerase 1
MTKRDGIVLKTKRRLKWIFRNLTTKNKDEPKNAYLREWVIVKYGGIHFVRCGLYECQSKLEFLKTEIIMEYIIESNECGEWTPKCTIADQLDNSQ